MQKSMRNLDSTYRTGDMYHNMNKQIRPFSQAQSHIAQASSSFKHFDMHHTIPTFITKVLHLVTYVATTVFTDLQLKQQLIQCWFTLIRLISTICFNSKATPIIDANSQLQLSYNGCRICLANHGVYIMPPVINFFRGRHTHARIPTLRIKTILRIQVHLV